MFELTGQDIDDDRKLGLNTSADFRQLPKEYRANPAKAFRNHRTRQKIMHYQTQEGLRILKLLQLELESNPSPLPIGIGIPSPIENYRNLKFRLLESNRDQIGFQFSNFSNWN